MRVYFDLEKQVPLLTYESLVLQGCLRKEMVFAMEGVGTKPSILLTAYSNVKN